MIPSAPHSIWFKPWMRDRCCLGTIKEVEACMAGQWNAPAQERMNKIRNTCQTCTQPRANNPASTPAATAPTPSATIIVMRRFQRSTRTPARGASSTCGTIPAMEENVNTVAEPVLTVSHQIKANWTIWLPRIENDCPNQMVKKFSAQRGGAFWVELASIPETPLLIIFFIIHNN